jgi:hypothetical protein
MTPSDQSSSQRICRAFFGLPPSFTGAMVFVHFTALLASVVDSTDTVIFRLSLGVDTRSSSDCTMCQRRVVSLDSISASRAIQLNVPLPASEWLPSCILTTEHTQQEKWSNYRYSLRGWYKDTVSYVRSIKSLLPCEDYEDPEAAQVKEEWEESWDPTDLSTPLATFQPHDVTMTANPFAFDESAPGSSFPFATEHNEEECWDPEGTKWG